MLDSVSWRVPQKVLYSQFSGIMHIQDLQQMMHIGNEMIETEGSETGVHGVIDVSRCDHYGADLMNLQSMRSLLRPHRKAGWVIIIDPKPHPVMRFISTSMIKLMKLSYAMANSDSEAIALLQRIDPELAQA